MKGLTDKQRAMLDFIEEFMDSKGMAPTVYEIAEHFKIKTSTVFAHLRSLQRKGYLTRSSKARSISLTRPRKRPKRLSYVMPLPLVGSLASSGDALARKEGEVFCDPALIGDSDPKKLFAVKFQGQSMRDTGILDGDILIARQSDNIKSGDIVVALVNGAETVVRSCHPLTGDMLELRPSNPDFKTQTYRNSDVRVAGVVVALQRKV